MNVSTTLLFAVLLSGIGLATGQTVNSTSPTPESETVSGQPHGGKTVDSRWRREQAYAKLLEGQRFIWHSHRLQTQAGKSNAMRSAKLAFQKAVEFDPVLSEGYTALAELAVAMQPVDIDESIRLAVTATRIAPDNFGGHRMLARLYTVKSRLNNGTLDLTFAEKAIEAWGNVTRLDPRNAEGWAFLSAFSEKKNQTAEQIELLRKWIASAAPIDVQFYPSIMGRDASLAPESASMKLGAALLKADRRDEAVETLSILIADDPNNTEAIDLLSEAIQTVEGKSAFAAIEALQQAVFANPENISLINMLASLQDRAGRFEDAVKLLKTNADKAALGNSRLASAVLVALGDLYIGKDRYAEAAEVFENALSTRGIQADTALSEGDRDFATYVFEKLIQVYKLSDRPRDIRTVIDRAKALMGKDDLFADRQLISHYRSTGNKTEAIAVTRSVRERFPNDSGLIRIEAGLLAETGKVDAAVALIRADMNRKPAANAKGGPATDGAETVSVMLPAYDAFSNHLFISNLYNKANRSREAAEAANQAFAAALDSERKQIAKLTLATAQQMGGDFKLAESTLREILKQTPGNPIALNNLGYFLIERDERIPEALGLIQQALKVDPKNPSYLDSLGWAYFKLGKLDDAERFLKDASRLDTDSPTIYEHLGDVYLKKQGAGLARWAWEKALRLASEAADIDRLKNKLKK